MGEQEMTHHYCNLMGYPKDRSGLFPMVYDLLSGLETIASSATLSNVHYQGNSIPSRCQNFPVSSIVLLLITFQSFSAASSGSTASGLSLSFYCPSAFPIENMRATISELTHIVGVEVGFGKPWMQYAHNNFLVLELHSESLEKAVHCCFGCSV